MKKFTIRGVIDGIRQSVTAPQKEERIEIEETLKSEHFSCSKIIRHGFPHQPTCMAWDCVQHLLALGTKSGAVRIFGRPGVDCYLQHEGEPAVLQMQFLVNEGALVTMCADDCLNLWNLRQKKPELVHNLKMMREKLTTCHLPFKSKWLYVGTIRGNVYILNMESFQLSGYVINWNKAIELLRKTHPGPVVHLSDNPVDPNKLLIGFESGTVVLWDLRSKTADARFQTPEPLKNVSWQHEGKQFMCCHGDGSLTTWNLRSPERPVSIVIPHAKLDADGKPDSCKAIHRLEWLSVRNGEPYTVFSGGTPFDGVTSRSPSLTVMRAKNTTVLEMEHNVVDFLPMCSSPYLNDFQEPYGIIVLLQNDLVVVDLLQQGYPCFENPYPMDLHESPVTCVAYYADCHHDLIPSLYQVGSKQQYSGFSSNDWPINGGDVGAAGSSYPELVITGHADGSIKFWDATCVNLQVLYKVKTAKLFDKSRCRAPDIDDDPFAIQIIQLDSESLSLLVAGITHVLVFTFCKEQRTTDITTLEITIAYEIYDDVGTPEMDGYPPPHPGSDSSQQNHRSLNSQHSHNSSQEKLTCVKVKTGSKKWPAGYVPDLACVLTWVEDEAPPSVTALQLNAAFGLLAFGNECGLAVIDLIQRCCLLNMGTPDLYGSMDPYSRVPRSPRVKNTPSQAEDSPTQDQYGGVYGAVTPVTSPIASPLSPPIPEGAPMSPAPPATPGTGAGPASSEVDWVRLDLASYTGIKDDEDEELNGDEAAHAGSEQRRDSRRPSDLPVGGVELLDDDSDSPQRDDTQQQHGLLRKMSRKVKTTLKMRPASSKDSSESESAPLPSFHARRKARLLEEKFELLDLTAEDVAEKPPVRKVSYLQHASWDSVDRPVTAGLSGRSKPSALPRQLSLPATMAYAHHLPPGDRTGGDGGVPPLNQTSLLAPNKPDGTFSRSRSSSINSLDNINKEAIQCLVFSDSYARKLDTSTAPCLWVGTSLGSVLVILLNIPPDESRRSKEPVIVSPSGTIFRMKGAILAISFLDSGLMPSTADPWKDTVDKVMEKTYSRSDPWKDLMEVVLDKKSKRQSSRSQMRMSPTSSTDASGAADRQLAVLCSEKHARVIWLPSQTCAYKVKITDTSFVTSAEIVPVRDGVCLACFAANGRVMIFSLPSLKPLHDVEMLQYTDLRIARTFKFSKHTHAIFFPSPSELQKLCFKSDFGDTLSDILGELFHARETPEAPKQSFLKNLFGGGAASLDRAELFGEQSGLASKSVAKYSSGSMAGAQARAGMATSEIARAKQAAIERGEKLGQLDQATEQMRNEAENYASSAHDLMMKYKNKRWYQF